MPGRSLEKMIGDAGSIAAARKMVRTMTSECEPDVAAVAELLTDELLTNAVQHGGGQFSLEAAIESSRLRVVVSDLWSSAPVTVYPPGHELEHGRGMTIIDAMATKWGVERLDSEKSVWFELDLE
jgi:anti-sigma regulatory factor (Ser/Thr protein kinase)